MLVCFLGFTLIITKKILFKHLTEQSFSHQLQKLKQNKWLGEFDIWSKRTFFTKKSWKLYFVETENTN